MTVAVPVTDPDWQPARGVKQNCPDCLHDFASIGGAEFCPDCLAAKKRQKRQRPQDDNTGAPA